MTKVCNRCGEEKLLRSYHRNGSSRDGRCPECKSQIAREHRARNRDRLVAQTRKYQEENRDYFRKYNREYRKRKREAAKA